MEKEYEALKQFSDQDLEMGALESDHVYNKKKEFRNFLSLMASNG